MVKVDTWGFDMVNRARGLSHKISNLSRSIQGYIDITDLQLNKGKMINELIITAS